MPRNIFLIVSLLCFACTAPPTHADTNPPEIETSKKFDKYTVFYNVFPSTHLQPDIAARYQIARANDKVVINVSLRASNNGEILPQPATVTGTYSDLIEQKNLEFREIREPGAIYYIAQLRVSNRELLRFDISIQPNAPAEENTPPRPLSITFTRRFAVDD